jgi:integrase/recombinase XerD
MRLADGVEIFVQRKRADGLIFSKSADNLMRFCRQTGNVPLHDIKAHHVVSFLDVSDGSTMTWRRKHSILQQFFDFWRSRGEMAILQMPPQRPYVRPTYVPHIYTREEIRRIVTTIRHYPGTPSTTIDRQTMSTLLLTLYATGTRIGEMCNLLFSDVDLKLGNITIRSNPFNRTRRIPVGPDLRQIFARYSNWKRHRKLAGTHYFVRRDGQPLVEKTVQGHFHRIRQRARLIRHDGAACWPRLNDFRSTFAVHRITSWVKSGADLNRMLPALSVYMGLEGLFSAERFLFLTPERFRKELDKLSPLRAKKHWRENATLMRFLEGL